MRGHYADFDFEIALVPPASGPYSVIYFNAPMSQPGAFGEAFAIDFRNLIPYDSAGVNVNVLLTGPLATRENLVAFSSFVGSHELGHVVGLRHGSSHGPIGAGISAYPGNAAYSPPFPGPPTATETGDHVMASPETGQTLDELLTEKFFGERSAIRLAFNEHGHVVDETASPHATVQTAMPIELRWLPASGPRPPRPAQPSVKREGSASL